MAIYSTICIPSRSSCLNLWTTSYYGTSINTSNLRQSYCYDVAQTPAQRWAQGRQAGDPDPVERSYPRCSWPSRYVRSRGAFKSARSKEKKRRAEKFPVFLAQKFSCGQVIYLFLGDAGKPAEAGEMSTEVATGVNILKARCS